MGTTSLHRPKGETTAAFFAREFGPQYAAAVLATATTPTCFYAVVEVPAEENTHLVADDKGMVRYAYVVKITKGSGYYNFSYKDMTEFVGPCESDCPIRLLDMLSPIKPSDKEDGSRVWAANWRARCRQRDEILSALVVGATFTVDTALNFGSFKASRFTLIGRRGTTMRFQTPEGYQVRLDADHFQDLKVAR